MPEYVDTEQIERLKRGFEARADDVLISTYPKSGTTWLQQIVTLLVNDGVARYHGRGLVDTAPWLEAAGVSTLSVDLETLNGLPAPRVLKTHLSLDALDWVDGRRVYGARDPKDVVTSYFHHMNHKQPDAQYTFTEFFEEFMAGRCMYGDWGAHCASALRRAADADTHIVFYENLHREPEETVIALARFLGVEPAPALIAQVIERSRFSVMATSPTTRFHWFGEAGSRTHYRKGIVGDWRTHLTARQASRLDQRVREIFGAVETPFPVCR